MGFTVDDTKCYAELGVDRLIPAGAGRSADQLVELVTRTADTLAGMCGSV
jgi:hypothetical protein